MPTPRTPLAWLSLVHDRRRFLAAAAGVAFAIVLMLVELGFLNAIYDSTTRLIETFDADLVVVSRLKTDTNPSQPFPRSQLERARAVAGVDEAVAVYLSRWGTWRSRGALRQSKVRLLAFDPDRRALGIEQVVAQQERLRRDDTALVDRRQRDSFGGPLHAGLSGELDGRRLDLVGAFTLGPDLELNATLVVSDHTFRRLFPPGRNGRDPLLDVDFGLLRLAPGASLRAVRGELEKRLDENVVALSKDALIAGIHRHWTRSKPVGAVFGLGVLVGFVIGVVICYQILYTDVVDHLPQFATLLAIGYPARHLAGLAVRRGLYLAAAAAALALPVGLVAYRVLADITGLTFRLSAGRIGLVLAAAGMMCVLASLLAMRRAVAADPAELF